MYNKFTNQEAIAMAMLVRDEIRNGVDLSDMTYADRLMRTDAMAIVINIAQYTVEKEKTVNG